MQADKEYEQEQELFDDYTAFLQYAREYNHIPYAKFDEHTISRINLFALRENYDFSALEDRLNRILATLPSIKRIFAKPITHIKEVSAILPVESVRVVNNHTLVHTAAHSELWENISPDGITPRKLLSLDHRNNYAIYENIAFAYAIHSILAFVGKNMRTLRNMLYVNRDMKFNLLDRKNHLSYFLAIGKLHIGYAHDYDKYRVTIERCLGKMALIDCVLRARLGRPVYEKCKNRIENFVLKKTNILRMHKDYHRVYLLLRWFADEKIEDVVSAVPSIPPQKDGYGIYCGLLSLFAAGHFNFKFGETKAIDFFDPHIDATFGGWQFKLDAITCGGFKALQYTFTKEAVYSIVLFPARDLSAVRKARALFREHFSFNEFLVADPGESGEGRVYISLFDVDSFRRIQQLFLRGMVMADIQRDTCPFCGRPLEVEKGSAKGIIHTCPICHMQIFRVVCPENGRSYITTGIKNFKPEVYTGAFSQKDSFLYARDIEAQMYFRNITPIGENGEILCPRCGKSHVPKSL